MSGLPWTRCSKMGKSWRRRCTSSGGAAGAGRRSGAEMAGVADINVFPKAHGQRPREPISQIPLDQHALQLVADRLNLDAADDVVGEGERQQPSRLLQRNAARLEIEELIGVELADGRAMGAFDVV